MDPSIITIDIALFRQQFPEFSNSTTYPDAQITLYWDLATCYISDVNWGYLNYVCRQWAINMMAAHLLKLATILQNGNPGNYQGASGTVQNASIDKVSVGLVPPPNVSQWQWWLNGTEYGKQLLALLQARSVGGFTVGGLPEKSAFRRVGGVFAA